MQPCCPAMRFFPVLGLAGLLGVTAVLCWPSLPSKGQNPAPGKGQAAEYVLRPYDVLRVRVVETLPNQPISGEYVVQPEGRVQLGWGYGALSVAGQTLDQAQKAIREHLAPILRDPVVFVDVAAYNSKVLQAAEEVRRLRESVEAKRAQLQEAERQLRLAEGNLQDVKLRGRLLERKTRD